MARHRERQPDSIASAKEFVEQAGFLSVTIALALLTPGSARLLGTDGTLAVFVAGVFFDIVVSGKERAEEENIQEAVLTKWNGWLSLWRQRLVNALLTLFSYACATQSKIRSKYTATTKQLTGGLMNLAHHFDGSNYTTTTTTTTMRKPNQKEERRCCLNMSCLMDELSVRRVSAKAFVWLITDEYVDRSWLMMGNTPICPHCGAPLVK